MEDRTDLVRQAVEAIWNRGELDAADALFAPHYVNHGGLIPDLVRGPEAVKLSAALYRLAFPDLRVSVQGLRVDGETVVLRWVARGALPEGPAGGPRASLAPGPEGQLAGVTRSRVVGGQIAESWTRWDLDGALRRLGLVRSADLAEP